VGIGLEGVAGRFKPDVVAPGTFVVSTRSQQWDQGAYYNPTNFTYNSAQLVPLAPFSAYNNAIFLPNNAVGLVVSANAVTPLINLPVTVSVTGGPTVTRTNQVSIPPDATLSPLETFWIYSISNNTADNVVFDWQTTLITTNDQGDFFQVLSNMNQDLGPYY